MTGGEQERSPSSNSHRFDETRPGTTASLDVTRAPGSSGRPPALTASGVIADTELLRIAAPAEPSPAGPGLTTSAGAADTELMRLPESAPGSGGEAGRLAASAGASDTELVRLPGSRGFTASPNLEETRAAAGGRAVDETRVTTGSVTRGDETVVRTDMRFAEGEAEEISAALTAVLSQGRIGRFVILRELGRGAMGVVLAAYDEELDRKVAIKLLHASRGYDASHGRAMLLREAQAMARLAHPNVVAVHEVGIAHGAVFVAMEYVAGVDLQQWLAERPRPWREVVATFRQAGAGLVAAHREGLVHRDFKPSNVLVGEDGRVRVADFGLAARRGATNRPAGATTGPTAMTATLAPEGALVGTPVYMAPELLRGGTATAKSDQFALCVALYEALHGERPFTGDTLVSLTEDVERGELPATPPDVEVPTWLHAAVCRGLSRAPEQRFASVEELMELLARDPEEERRQRRRRALQIAGVIAGTAVIVTLVVFAAAAVRRYAAEREAEARLAVLREQIAARRAGGDEAEAVRLLRSFVALPENRGRAVVARAYIEWAAAERDDAAAVDAYASAYISARTAEDGQAALRGLVERLAAQRRIAEAAAALRVLERAAPDLAAAPELQPVRLAAALEHRDLAAARAVLEADDPEGWGPVFEDLSHGTWFESARFGGPILFRPHGEFAAADIDGDGREEVLVHRGDAALRLFRADAELTPLGTVALGDPHPGLVRPVAPVATGEPLLLASYPGARPEVAELRLLDVRGETPRVIDAWEDSPYFHALTLDVDGDGRREVYVGTEAYARKLWRLEQAADGTWSRRSAHPPTDAVASDISLLVAADLEGDGRRELVAGAGPWRAYDLRVYRPKPDGELDLVARRAFGSFRRFATVRVGGAELVAFTKIDFQIAPNRFPPEQPLGEPAGLYVVGLREGQIEVVAHLPEGAEDRQWGLHAGDLDGDGNDELVIDGLAGGMELVRVRPGQPLRPLRIRGLRPVLVRDLDGDGRAEILAQPLDTPDRVLLLGAGSSTLPPLPGADLRLRSIPSRIEDPVIAEAWTHAEQLVAVGLPKRTADELSAIAGLAGHVAQDMLLRAAELYAGLGEDAAAAEHYEAAATRPDLAATALAGAAAARRRLGEFAAAAELTHRWRALPDADAAVADELAALDAANAPRPEVALTFARPLDERWRIADPVSLQRALKRGALSVWTSPAPVLAEYPLEWDGGAAALEVEFEVDDMEWGTALTVEVLGRDDQPWLFASIEGHGVSERPHTIASVGERGQISLGPQTMRGKQGRVKVALYPGLRTSIRELEIGEGPRRMVIDAAEPSLAPHPGPVRLRVTSRVLQPEFVGHVWISAIRLTGFTRGQALGEADDPALLLAEGERAKALAALRAAPASDERRLWRIDALLGLGETTAAGGEIAALQAMEAAQPSLYQALLHRLRRADQAAGLAARVALGPRLVDLVLNPEALLWLRPAAVEFVLEHMPATDPDAAPRDPEAALRLVLTDHARGLALKQVGRFAAAREVLAAALARVERSPDVPHRERLRVQLLRDDLEVVVAMADREEAIRRIRVLLAESQTPYLVLERLQSNRALVRLLGPEVWEALQAELRAARP